MSLKFTELMLNLLIYSALRRVRCE